MIAAKPVLSAFLVLAGALAPAADAQFCFTFDGMSGYCCTDTTPALPPFPPMSLPASTICWTNCNLTSQDCASVQFSAPAVVGCTNYQANLSVSDCAGNALLAGTVQLDYTRTWQEINASGVQVQCWRFLAKVDMSASGGGSNCQVPSSLGTHPTVFYYGYVDYSFDCVTALYESSLVLYHGCDRYQHDPLISSRPGSFDPDRSFAIVAPDTGANPFLPAATLASDGPLLWEGMRNTTTASTTPPSCEATEQLSSGGISNIAAVCGCPLSLNSLQTTLRSMEGQGICGSDFRSINVFPILPWYHVHAVSIGQWTNPATYPGDEAVWVDEGVFLNTEVCPVTGTVDTYVDVMYGASTERGWFALWGPVGGDRFIDLADNFSAQLGTPITPPFVGHVMPTERLVYVNGF